MFAASRAQGGMPSRLPIEPGEAAMIASCWSRVRPSHQELTSSGLAPEPGMPSRAASAGSATPPYRRSTCSSVSTRLNASRIASSSAIRSVTQVSRSVSKARTRRAQSSHSAWIAGTSATVADAALARRPAIVEAIWERSSTSALRRSTSCCILSAWSSALRATERNASDIASAVRPIGRMESWYDVEPRPVQSPIRASPAAKLPRSSTWVDAGEQVRGVRPDPARVGDQGRDLARQGREGDRGRHRISTR